MIHISNIGVFLMNLIFLQNPKHALTEAFLQKPKT